RILVAVSSDNNPNNPWYYQAINSKLTINNIDRWADYDQLAVDANAVYVSANMWGFGTSGAFAGARLWILNKTPFYTGGTPSVSSPQDPGTLAGLPLVSDLLPAQIFGTPQANVGTFFISTVALGNGHDGLSIIRLENALTTPTFNNQFVDLGVLGSGATF